MTYWYGSGSSDPYPWLTDPDPNPDLLFGDLQGAKKSFFSYYFLKEHLHHYSQINIHKEVIKHWNQGFHTIFNWWDPDPGGPKIHGADPEHCLYRVPYAIGYSQTISINQLAKKAPRSVKLLADRSIIPDLDPNWSGSPESGSGSQWQHGAGSGTSSSFENGGRILISHFPETYCVNYICSFVVYRYEFYWYGASRAVNPLTMWRVLQTIRVKSAPVIFKIKSFVPAVTVTSFPVSAGRYVLRTYQNVLIRRMETSGKNGDEFINFFNGSQQENCNC